MLDLDPTLAGALGLHLATAVLEAQPATLPPCPVGCGPDLLRRFVNGPPAKIYNSIIRSTVRRAESKHDSLRASLMTLEEMRSSVADAMKRMYKLKAESSFEVIDCADSKVHAESEDMNACKRRCLELRFFIVP